MRLVKTINTTMGLNEIMPFTDYNIDDDYIPYPIECLDLNYFRMFLDDKIITDYSTIYKAHKIIVINHITYGIGVVAEQSDFDDVYNVTINVYVK